MCLLIGWTFSAIMRTTMCIVQIILNLAMSTMIFSRKSLRTSFTVYVVFLLSSNLLVAIMQYPLEIQRILYRKWSLSEASCTLYLYNIWVLLALPIHSHLLLTINRLWALTFPLSYKNHHSKRVAGILCGVTLLYIHVFFLPLVIIDRGFYRASSRTYGCTTNYAMPMVNKYAIAVQMVGCNIPLLFIVVVFPYLAVMERQRKRTVGLAQTATPYNLGIMGFFANAIAQPNHSHSSPNKARAATVRRNNRLSNRPFALLTLLTISITICWTPIFTYWTTVLFVPLGSDYSGFRNFASALVTLQPALDPILFGLSLRNVRKVFVQQITCR
ncbi:octopamine receptor beta-2R-like isoform X2 [Paramacrobiotus metropolitanus]|uniref:octopamine receptor beta-2R-like isoform X2 n=1 Tax=Paramacrobiotus metropolitanus TaxID=2943436 RepID=UPI002445F8BE|nr:octopamine receptor beta-2R-like isoform X2 [Paramacrobiotus metropolitanus]